MGAARQLPPSADIGTEGSPLVKLRGASELILHPAERRMPPVFDLDPMPELAAAIGALAVLGDRGFQQAGIAQ